MASSGPQLSHQSSDTHTAGGGGGGHERLSALSAAGLSLRHFSSAVCLSPFCFPCSHCAPCSERRKGLFVQDLLTCKCSCKFSQLGCKSRQLELNERTCRFVAMPHIPRRASAPPPLPFPCPLICPPTFVQMDSWQNLDVLLCLLTSMWQLVCVCSDVPPPPPPLFLTPVKHYHSSHLHDSCSELCFHGSSALHQHRNSETLEHWEGSGGLGGFDSDQTLQTKLSLLTP